MQQAKTELITHDDLAAWIVGPLWRGVPADYKAKYRMTIWQQFEDNIRSAAYTSSFARFLNQIAQRLGVRLSDADAGKIASVAPGQDAAILRMLRDETTLVVLLVRAANEERREKYQQSQPKPIHENLFV